MNKIEELTKKCKENLTLSDKLKFAHRLILESQQSQFYYAEKDVRKLLKELSPFTKIQLSAVCEEFADNHEYFASDIVRDFIIAVKSKLLTAGQEDDSYLDSVECIYMSGGSSFSYKESRECTASEFCVEFVDSKTRKQFSILFPVVENYYFRTDDDIEKVLNGTYKLFNLGLTYSESDRIQFRYDSYHPCICATNDVEELAAALKTFLTTDTLDMHDIYSSALFKIIEEHIPYGDDCHNGYAYWYKPFDSLSDSMDSMTWSRHDDKTTNLVKKESIISLLHHLSVAYDNVEYKQVKLKDKYDENN